MVLDLKDNIDFKDDTGIIERFITQTEAFMAASLSGLDALPTLEAQIQELFIESNKRENSLTVPLGIFTTTYDLEAGTASFTATGIPVTVDSTGGIVTITAQPIPTLP